jgi:capsular exopolysaccharide synthesis family protein
MSRIYEALKRADDERETPPGLEDDRVVELASDNRVLKWTSDYRFEESPAPKSNFVFEQVTKHSWSPSAVSLPTLADRGAGVEQFRSLRSRVYQARYESPLKTLLISSGMPSEGKSFVAANLAMSLARNSMNNILLIDGDLRRPTLHSLLGAPNVPGLSEYLSGTAELNSIMQRDEIPETNPIRSVTSVSNLTLIPAGKCGDNSSELVANHRIDELIASLSPHFDWILIDSPPVLAVTDAVELARASDGVLLVVRGGTTPFDVAQRTQATFKSSRIIGFVLNDVKDRPRTGSYYYYYGGPESSGKSNRGEEPRSHE